MSLSQNLKWKLQDWLGITDLQKVVLARQPSRAHGKSSHGVGKVVTGGAKIEYTPDSKAQGGRIVRTMPRELKHIKDGQERRGVV